MADTHGLGPCAERRAGSTPVPGTTHHLSASPSRGNCHSALPLQQSIFTKIFHSGSLLFRGSFVLVIMEMLIQKDLPLRLQLLLDCFLLFATVCASFVLHDDTISLV